MSRGKFIVLEGIDGSGTTTQARVLADYLNKEGYKTIFTFEPTDLETGKEIKRRLREDENPKENPFLYARLFVEDRKEHLKQRIIPNLEKGVNVVCDRYKYSTLSYQQTQGMDLEELKRMHEGCLIPDIVFLLDLPAEIALERRVNEGTPKEKFEKLEFQETVRKNYLALKEKLPKENIVIVDGSGPIEKVFEKIKYEVDGLF